MHHHSCFISQSTFESDWSDLIQIYFTVMQSSRHLRSIINYPRLIISSPSKLQHFNATLELLVDLLDDMVE